MVQLSLKEEFHSPAIARTMKVFHGRQVLGLFIKLKEILKNLFRCLLFLLDMYYLFMNGLQVPSMLLNWMARLLGGAGGIDLHKFRWKD